MAERALYAALYGLLGVCFLVLLGIATAFGYCAVTGCL